MSPLLIAVRSGDTPEDVERRRAEKKRKLEQAMAAHPVFRSKLLRRNGDEAS